jgi:hypothetical protein
LIQAFIPSKYARCRARLAKALLALAYAPRWLVAALGSLFSGELRRQARVFRRLLSQLPGM